MSAMQVQSIIIQTGEPAIALGGFMGADPVLTKDKFIELVDQGQLRYVLADGPGLGGGFPSAPDAADGFLCRRAGAETEVLRYPIRTIRNPFPPAPPGPDHFRVAPADPEGAFPPGGPLGGRNAEIMEWVRDHGKLVDAKLWRTNADEEPDDPRHRADPHAASVNFTT